MQCESYEFDVISLSQLKMVNMDIHSDMSNDLLHIRSDLFGNQQDVDLNLDNLFSEVHSFGDFIGLECKKYESLLGKSCERLMARLLDSKMSEARVDVIKEQMIKLGLIKLDKVSIFDFDALKQQQFDFFVKKLHSTYTDNALGNLRCLLNSFIELVCGADGNSASLSNKTTKKVLWTSGQENELLMLMQRNYPENLTNQQIIDFCDRNKRTRRSCARAA